MSSLSEDGPSPTAADAISTIRNTLSHLVSPAGLHLSPPNDAHLHSLSPLCLPTARRTLSTALDILLGSAKARETWDSTASVTDRLRRVKADTVVKRRAIQASKTALAECKRLANTQDPFATPVALAVQRLRAVADATGAITDESVELDGSMKKRLLTVCGRKFIADFHFTDVGGNDVNVKVNFRYLTADDAEVGDPQVDVSFADYIKRDDFGTLKAAFEKLIKQEKLDALVNGVSLTDALRFFEEDLLAAHMAELKGGLDEDTRMRIGHGVIKRSALGLCLKFMEGQTAILGIEDATPPRKIAVGRAHPSLLPELQTDGIPVFEFGDCKMVATNAQYVLTFRKPVHVCLSVAQSLERVVLESEVETAEVGTTGGDRVEQSMDKGNEGLRQKHYWPSLQKLLAPLVFATPEAGETNGDVAAAKEVVKKRDHWSQQSAEYIAAVELPDGHYVQFNHSGSDMIPGIALHRVPLCHPRNVKPIFALVRQQIVFNTLFVSCFAKPIYVEPGLTPIQPQPVEVVLCDAPSFMQFNMFETSLNDILSMAVSIELGGEINVALKTTSDQQHICSDRKATAILRACRSIPLTLLTIVRLAASGTLGRS